MSNVEPSIDGPHYTKNHQIIEIQGVPRNMIFGK